MNFNGNKNKDKNYLQKLKKVGKNLFESDDDLKKIFNKNDNQNKIKTNKKINKNIKDLSKKENKNFKNNFNKNFNLRNKLRLEPREMQAFLMKPKRSNPRKYPYLPPKEAFFKFNPIKKIRAKKEISSGVLRIIPLGGMEQVGLNCIVFEYKNEVIIIDMGIQFSNDYLKGITGRIPDLNYVKGKKVKAVCITHGHIDHIGAVPYLMRMLGADVPIYAGKMAKELIIAKQKEYGLPLKVNDLFLNKIYSLSNNFYLEPFIVDHSIPDSMGFRIHTPVGKFIHTGDWKFDPDPRKGVLSVDHNTLKRFGREGVKALLSDSTNAHLIGSSISEKQVSSSLEDIFLKSKNSRIITGTFSSIIDRLQIIVNTAIKYNRKVCFLGRGMNTYVDIAKRLGHLKIKKDDILSIDQANKLAPSQVCICCTGAQGERYAALMRIATGESKDTHLKKGDTVILSSSVIPGNERNVQDLMDLLTEQGVTIHHYRQSNIHSGGHAKEEEIKQMLKEINPEYFVPIYGERFMVKANQKIAEKENFPYKKIFTPWNGQILEFTKEKGSITPFFTSQRMMTVDGYMIGVSKDEDFLKRKQLSTEGVLIININKLKNNYNIQFNTFASVNFNLFLEEKRNLIKEIELILKTNIDKNEKIYKIKRKAQGFVWKIFGKEPVILVVI